MLFKVARSMKSSKIVFAEEKSRLFIYARKRKAEQGNPLEEIFCWRFCFPYSLIKKKKQATDYNKNQRYSSNRNGISPLIICGVYQENTDPLFFIQYM
jgi:hypothetical protein